MAWLDPGAAYAPVWQAMQAFTASRSPVTRDAIWMCEHAPVYTLGQAGREEHILNPAGIEVVRCDRGGQVTYHGPGQIVAYSLFDLRRAGMYVRDYVFLLEEAAIAVLRQAGITAVRRTGAPGVYVEQSDGRAAKIAALGIKVRNGCAYHGMALNVAMDLAPFSGINPCGYEGLRTTDMASCGVSCSPREVGQALADELVARLSRFCAQTPAAGAPVTGE
ncbi:lipoate--protein ligase [Bordetella holmesii F627]|nr:lipoate--protein ligase [Bordetella holmesii F627]